MRRVWSAKKAICAAGNGAGAPGLLGAVGEGVAMGDMKIEKAVGLAGSEAALAG